MEQGPLGKLFGFLFSLVILVALAGAGIGAYGYYLYTRPGPATDDGQPRILTIEKGASADSIAGSLSDAGVIADPLQMRLVMRSIGKLQETGVLGGGPLTLKAGEYAIESGASMRDVVALLKKGSSLQYAVVVPEGMTSAAIINLLRSGEWRSNARPDEVIKLEGEAPPTPAEGSLLPGDYMVQRGATIASVVDRMRKAQEQLAAEVWPPKRADLPFKSLQEAITLASIVEKETGVKEERGLVAAVFVNRLMLNPPMRLETDPTIIYGVCLKKPESCKDGKLVDKNGRRRTILASEIALNTGYNTYRIEGLPPTPICNPGRDAIESVLDPPAVDYLFFVADGSGGHSFSRTYAEHAANVAKWRPIEKQRLDAQKGTAAAVSKP